MDIEQAIKEIKGKDMFSSRTTENGYAYMKGINEAIDTVLSELEKKDKVIDEILNKFIEGTGYYYSEFDYMSKEEIKEYFYKKVENSAK